MIKRNTSATVALVAAGFSCVSFVFGCSGAPDRPPPSSVDSSTSIATPTPASVNHDACQAGTWRECRVHYVDEDGQNNCPTDYELCREDGSGYYECGSWVNGANNTPVARSALQHTP
jgi:hypothetical protein